MTPEEAADELLGTCETGDEVCERMGIDVSDLEDRMAEEDIFRCATCGWWCEMHEMADEDGNCEDCVD